MSNLFNINTMLYENANPLSIIQTFNRKTFLLESIDMMRDIDNSIDEQTKSLYVSLLEATSVAQENAKFSDFFKEYEKTIHKYILKARELVDKFSINVETFVDANNDILDIPDNTNIMNPVKYIGVEYDNLLDDDIPKIDPYKMFKKEFAFIGSLMQDLGPIGTDEAKAQIVATVCNNLSKEINDGWIDKCVEKIIDCDDCGADDFAKAVYKKFIKNPSMEICVDIGTVKQAKLSILNYTRYVDCINKSVSEFCDGLSKVASEIGSLFYRNRDKKLPIKTDAEGVEDKTYRLNDYAYNQFNQFISTKITQITELCNLYIIALSVKMDCIIKYLQQCKDIVNTAANGIDNTPNTETDPGDSDIDNDGKVDDTESDMPVTVDDNPDDNDIPDDDTDDVENNPDQDTAVEQDNSETEIEQEFYLFDARMYQKERLINKMIIKESVYDIMLEDENRNGNIANTIGSKAKSVKAIIDNLTQQMKNLVQKFISSFTNNYDKQIEYINKNKQRILKAVIPKNWTIQRIDIDKIMQYKLEDFKNEDIELLSDRNKYLTVKYSRLLGPAESDTQSIKDRLNNSVFNKNEDHYTNNDRQQGLNYVTNQYKQAIQKVQDAQKTLESAKNKTNNIVDKGISTNESFVTLEETLRYYFSEDGTETTEEDKKKNSQANPAQAKEANKSKAVQEYFTISTSLNTAMMNMYNTTMKKHLSFLTKLAQLNGATPLQQNNAENNNQNNNDNSQQNNK